MTDTMTINTEVNRATTSVRTGTAQEHSDAVDKFTLDQMRKLNKLKLEWAKCDGDGEDEAQITKAGSAALDILSDFHEPGTSWRSGDARR